MNLRIHSERRIKMQGQFKLIVSIFWVATSLLLGAFNTVFCQEDTREMVLAKYEKMSSKILGEEFEYLVDLPSGYDKTVKKYPVIYVMNSHMISTFATALATLDRLSFEAIPQMILVGLCNDKGRARNTFPVRPNREPGGADTFLSFLTDELIPHIDGNYRTEKYRILAGQSNTGLFVLYALLEKPKTFNGYIAASPSLGWCLDFMKDKARCVFSEKSFSKRFLYMNYGERDYKDLVIDPTDEMKKLLDEISPDDFEWKFEIIENDIHVPLASLNNGLLALFPDYMASDSLKKKGLAAVDQHYRNLSQKYGYLIEAPEEVLFNMAYNLKQEKKFQESISSFKVLLERFPFSVRGAFFLGETFRETGDVNSAKEMYRKTLELNPEFNAAKDRLKELEKETP